MQMHGNKFINKTFMKEYFNLKIFCLDLYDEDYEKIKSLGFLDIGKPSLSK